MKNVLITGGARGIGEACVRLFSKKGFRVFFLYRTSSEKATEISTQTGAISYCADVSDKESVFKVIDDINRTYGAIDILVNNAGISQQKLFIDITENDWRKMLDVNMTGAYNVTQAVINGMIAEKSGCIINVSSIWGECGASCEVHYSASKAGLIGFTKALAKELGLSGIRVNCITPGMIETDMNAHLSEEDISDICGEIPLMRMGKPSECAELIYFLASDDASYITGQIIGINGGWEM